MDSCIRGKTKVALFLGKYKGKFTSFSELVLRLDENRFDIIFIYFGRYDVERNLTQQIGRRVFCLFDRKQGRTFNLSILCRLVRILKEQKVDIIHCSSHECTVYGTLAAMIARTPVVLAHVRGLGKSRRLRRKLINLLLFRRINKLIPVAHKVKEDVLKNNWFLSADKLLVLENSVDYERFAEVAILKEDAKQMLDLPKDAFVYGTVGRLAPTKGLSYLIEAFAKVKQQMPSAQLIVVGEGRLRNELEQQAAGTSCADSIHFLGHRKNIPELLRAMDVFVLSSIAEGMPKTILEAMAAGVPCIGTNVGGVPEILADGESGYLVPSRDECSLADAMVELVKKTDEEVKQLVEKARQRAKSHYTHEVIVKRLEQIYETCMVCN